MHLILQFSRQAAVDSRQWLSDVHYFSFVCDFINAFIGITIVCIQDSLGGNAKTVMIANMGPADYN